MGGKNVENEPLLFYIIKVSSCKGKKLIGFFFFFNTRLLNVCAEQPLIVGAE